jgi:uncharacterized protein YacL
MQASPRLKVRIQEEAAGKGEPVDARLVHLCQSLGTRLATNDFNLAKVARIEKVDVVSISDLAAVMRVPYLPGEELVLKMSRSGEQRGQGVGYLDDGTMVVVEDAREDIGREIRVTVTNTLQTVAGRMIFARKAGEVGASGGKT